jgi:hypothetical protein
MLSINTFKRLTKYQSKRDIGDSKGMELLVNPEQIKLIRVNESNDNYHNKVEVKYDS